MSELPDYVEVARQAHELGAAHGMGAHEYAAKLARQALADGELEKQAFWEAVEAALKPRQNSN